jgi:hypothetical protein
MNVNTLNVVGSLSGRLELSLEGDRGTASATIERSMAGSVGSPAADPAYLEQLLTPDLVRTLRQWTLDEPGTSILAVACTLGELDGIPWEHLPRALELPSICVVRLLRQEIPIPYPHARAAPKLLAAGWSGKPRFKLPGISEELLALGNLWSTTGYAARVLFDPTLDELASGCASFTPDIVHLVPPAIDSTPSTPQMVISGSDDIQMVDVDRFLSVLPKDLRPQLVVINSCSSGATKEGPSMTRMVAAHWGAVTIGWMGIIEDLSALDFARFFYSRLLEGRSICDVIQAYASLQSAPRNVEQPTRDLVPFREEVKHRPVPVIWAPKVAAVAEPLVLTRATTTDRSRQGRGLARPTRGQRARDEKAPTPKSEQAAERETSIAKAAEDTTPKLEVVFEPQPWLNPALLKNGRPAITRLVLNPDRSLRNLELTITCDTGNGISAVRQTIDLDRGPQPVPTEDRQFPVLYELIEASVPRRQINFTVACHWGGRLLAERTISVLWMGRAEWLDQSDTWHYVPAFVNPYDDGVLDVLDHADAILKTIAGPESSFSGYQEGDGDHVMKQVEALFNCLRDHFKLNYITPPPISVFVPGALHASGQRVRRPEEVINRRRGTCHDLAVLLASCMEHIGIHPLIYLIQGHTFVGFWRSDDAHADFWEGARKKKLRMPQVPGREWTITDLPEIQDLLKRKAVTSVEATKVTNRNATFGEALKDGSRRWQEKQLELQRFDVAIDVRASRRLVQPL